MYAYNEETERYPLTLAELREKYPNNYELEEWTTPESYGGFDPVGDYPICGRSRDSRTYENVNYERILEDLQKLEGCMDAPENPDLGDSWDISSYIYDYRAGHWASGWVEVILCRRDAPDHIQKAVYETLAALEDYPLYDEMAVSDAEFEAVSEYWENLSIRERVGYIEDFNEYNKWSEPLSIFAARRFPEEDFYYFMQESICY